MKIKSTSRSAALPGEYAGRILAIDDDRALLSMIEETLSLNGHNVEVADNPVDALKKIHDNLYDLLLIDLVLPGMDGIALLKEAKKMQPETEVIIITGYGNIESAVKAIKEGAYNYITKPFEIEKFRIDVQKALEKKNLQEDIDTLKKKIEGEAWFGGLIGCTSSMLKIFGLIRQVALTDCTVLILGESGTGKELVAQEIHRRSSRKAKPFIAVSCGALPQSLLESELFGHMKGAFTGALSTKVGFFEAADGGTVFLDEIGTANMQTQIGLLRVLQNREIRKIGSTTTRKVDVRIIAATNLDLKKAIEKGEFREDLFYRLNSVAIHLPPLRERPEDIVPLTTQFISTYCKKQKKPQKELSPKVIEILMSYAWPGNVRELENVIENVVTFSEREIIRPKDLPPEIASEESAGKHCQVSSLEIAEEEHIRKAVTLAAGNKKLASRMLKIPRATLYRKMQKYGID